MNEIVLGGYLLPDGSICQVRGSSMYPEAAKVVVGANIKFDLLWAARQRGTTPAKLTQGQRIWDVCHVEYLLQRQRVAMPSLEVCAELRGIHETKHPLSEVIKSGTCPSTVPPQELEDYHKQDLRLTHKVFLAQYKEAKERGMLPLIWSQMQALVATAEMEHYGVHIDLTALNWYRVDLDNKRINVLRDVEDLFSQAKSDGTNDLITKTFVPFAAADIIGSNQQLSLLFFGGKTKEKVRKVVGSYMNGKDKFKTELVDVTIRGDLDPTAVGATKNKLGYFTVDESVLKNIQNRYTGFYRNVAELTLKYREYNKQLTTYVDGVAKNIWPDGRVHCSFNHNVTLTGRLSCSNPNLQNQTDGEIKRVYKPRNEHGVFIEFDYSQLEVVGLAVLSGDKQLIHDIRTGTDIHTALYIDMYGSAPTKEQRKAFKPLTFGLIYGAGAKTMAENSGLEVTVAKVFIDTFYRRYPQVRKYHSAMIDLAFKMRTPTALKTELGYPRGSYVHRLFTGREFEFLEYDKKYMFKPGMTSFSPTELKNWPIQGWATGDIVPMMVGYVVAEITKSEWYGIILPLTTVHDSLLFEVTDATMLDDARNFLDDLLSKTRTVIMEQFGVDVGLDFKTENKCGLNWKDLT